MARVVILGPAHPLRGGIADFNQALASELQNQGHEVDIVSFSLQYPSFLFPGKTQYTNSPTPKGLRIHTKINSINPFNWIKTARWIDRNLRPDIVIVRYWLPFMAPALGTIIRKLKRKNPSCMFIGLCDNVIPHEKRPFDTQLTRYFVKACDKFVVMSSAVMYDLRTFSRKPVACLTHPIYNIFGAGISKSEARQKLNIPENEPVVLFFGFIRKYKGLDILLEALTQVDTKIKLLLAGEFYGNEPEYLDKINALNLQERIYFHTSYIPEEQVHQYFCAADVVIQPYLSATQSGVSQVAYSFNKPMIVTGVGGLDEVVVHQKTGFVCEVVRNKKDQILIPETSKNLASWITAFYAVPEGYFEPYIASEEHQKQYRWDHFVQQLLDEKAYV